MKLSEAAVWEPTERWTTVDAGELYDVASWGKGYFSVGANGHLWVHPTKDPARGIDLRELVEKLELRGISLADPDPLRRNSEAPAGRNAPGLPELHRRARLQGQLLLRVSDQGEPAAAGGGRSLQVRPPVSFRAGSRLEAGVAGGAGHRRQRDAHHLQRLQGRRIHRDGDAGQENRPADHPGGGEIHGAGSDPEAFAAGRRAARDRAAA